MIIKAGDLHDVGKLGIPDEIITKPGPLTDEEWEFMKQHTVMGEQIIAAAGPVARADRPAGARQPRALGRQGLSRRARRRGDPARRAHHHDLRLLPRDARRARLQAGDVARATRSRSCAAAPARSSTRASSRSSAGSSANGRAALGPRPRALELGGQREQRDHPARARRRAGRRRAGPTSLQCSGRLTAGRPVTLPNAVNDTLATTSNTRLVGRGVLGLEDRARERRQDRRGRGEQDVEVAPPARQLAAAEQLERARREHVVVGAQLAARRRWWTMCGSTADQSTPS